MTSKPPASGLQTPDSPASPYRDRAGHVLTGEGYHRVPDPDRPACAACGLPTNCLQALGSDGRHRTCSAKQGDPAEARWAVLSATDSIVFLDAAGNVVAQRWRNQRGAVLTAETFHQSPDPDAAACPVCGLPSERFKTRWKNRPHRARRQDDHPPEARWFMKFRQNCIHALGADGKRLPASLLVTGPQRDRLRQAAGRIAFGVPIATVAKLLGIRADTLYRSMVKYADVFKEEMQRAKDQGPSALQAPVEREKKERIPPWVRQAVRGATAAIAAGMTQQEVNESLGLLPGTIGEWKVRYPKLWQDELARAMSVSVALVRQLAGSEAVAADPEAYLKQARAAERFCRKQGEPLFPSKEEPTLASFYASHYKPARLFEAAKDTIDTYELIVRRWALLTGDPPLKEITVETLTQFRDCIACMRGRDPVARRSAASVHQYLMHVQAILDKAGPPGPRNRDAAGILTQPPPWIKRPRLDVGLPQVATLDQLDALYRSCVSADRPLLPGTGIKPPAWWRALLAVALGTGLRKRTLFELRMEHVDWEKRLIIIPAKHLKSRRPQIVPLSHTALEHLRTIRTGRELVFPWPHGEHAFYLEMHRLQTLAGIDRSKQFGLHRIRKTTATLLWESNPQAAQLALGHSTDRVTRAYYVSGAGIMAKALDAMPLPGAFTEGMGDGNGHSQGDGPDGHIAGDGEPGRKALDQLTSLLHGLSLSPTVQAQILALAAAGDQGPAPTAALTQTT